MPSVFNVKHPRARRRHRCCECCGWIEPGERYEYCWGIWEGDAASYKTCLQCAKLRDEVEKIIDCCVGLGGLDAFIYDHRDPALIDRFHAIQKS